MPKISYSQIAAYNEKKGFNTGLKGSIEYIKKYFFGEKFEDKWGFAQFGNEVEGYITERKFADCFDDREKEVLDKIIPLGIFQREFNIDMGGFILGGYIDDSTPDFHITRDYKTCSRKSGLKYEEDDYTQLDLYALVTKKEYGYIPDRLEVVCIDRTGNPFKGGGRSVLKVGKEHWTIERKTNPERLKMIEENIRSTVKEISELYKVYQKLITI
jgi:hypothetical protein